MKVCPVCKSRCFDDMGTCYNCLYNFNENIKPKEDLDKNDLPRSEKLPFNNWIPEYFEVESCPYIEDVNVFENYKYSDNKKSSCNCRLLDWDSGNKNIILNIELSKKQLLDFIGCH